jgi:nickel superoxide dismutase
MPPAWWQLTLNPEGVAMSSTFRSIIAAVAVLTAVAGYASAHCQVPCGIYDDPVRITLLEEHVTTIEKAMKSIVSLSAEKRPNSNQIARWVSNKEKHAEELTGIVTYYFMAQRVKPSNPKYVEQVTTLHQIIVQAMKAKQTTDLEHVAELRKLIAAFKKSYLG